MKKQFSIVLLFFVLLVLGGWGILKKKISPIHPFRALPPYVNQVVSFSYYQLEMAKDLPKIIKPQAKDFALLKQAFEHWLDKEFTIDPIIHYAYDRNNPGLVSSLMILQCKEARVDIKKWTSFIPEQERTEHRYRGQSIIHFNRKDGQIFYFAMKKGLLFFSSDQRLVERSIALLGSRNPNLVQALKKDKLNFKGKETATKIFLNTGELNQPHWNQLSHFEKKSRDSLSAIVFKENTPFQNILSSQSRVNFADLLEMIPDRIQLVDMISLGNPHLFFQNKENIGPQLWRNELRDQVKGKISYVQENVGRGTEMPSFLIIPLKDVETTKDLLIQLGDQNGLLEQHEYQAENIFQIIAENVSLPFFGDQYPDIRNPYYLIKDGYLILSNNPDRLKLWLDYLLVQNNLANADWISPYLSNLGVKNQRIIIWKDFVAQDSDQQAPDWWTAWADHYPSGVLSWNKKRRNWKLSGQVGKRSDAGSLAKVHWRRNFRKPIIYGPYLIEDPLAKREYSLWIQDDENHLEVLDRDGQTLWAIDLDGPIIGKAKTFQINPIEWGLLFNTNKSIYKLNSQGELMTRWPLNLPATGGLSLASFGEEGDPYFFLPTEENRIYAYNILGDAVIDWNPCLLYSTPSTSIFHIASNQRDYHFWLDQNYNFKAKYRNTQDVELAAAPDRIQSIFLSEKNKKIFSISENGEIGSWSSDLAYKTLKKERTEFQDFQFLELAGEIYVLLTNENTIYRYQLDGDDVKKERLIPNDGWTHSLELVNKGNQLFTLVFNENRGLMNLIDDKGKKQLSESLPASSNVVLFEQNDQSYIASRVGEELVVYGIPF